MSVRQQATPIARLRLSYWSSSHPTASLFVRHTFRFQFKNNNVDCRSKTRQVRDWNTSASFDAAMIVLLSFSCRTCRRLRSLPIALTLPSFSFMASGSAIILTAITMWVSSVQGASFPPLSFPTIGLNYSRSQ